VTRAFRLRGWSVPAIAAALVLSACTGSSAPGTGGGGGGGGAYGGGSTPGGKAASIDACSLLTPDEIKQQLGVAVDNGLLQTTDTQASCDWTAPDGSGKAVGIIVMDFDQSLWNAMSSAGNAKAVSGFGEAAFSGEPAPGDLSIKQGSYEVDVGVINFSVSNDDAQAEAQALAALILPRL
jgi:hypothetical protein